MSTLHILRSEPDEQVLELIQGFSPGEIEGVGLLDDATNYDDLLEAIFSHDNVISWW